MDQKKTGQFLKTLRKEKQITQEALAEILHVSNRTVSRWETGSNMPDISLLVELAEFYQVSITEIIDGERKSEKMNQETKMTAMKKRKIISVLLMIFGVFVMISALAVFPNESSWGSIYATIGGAGLTVGGYLWMRSALVKMGWRILGVAGCIVALFGFFTVSDYIVVTQFHQVPRFSYEKSYGENVVEHRTLFYTVIQRNPGTADERVEIER